MLRGKVTVFKKLLAFESRREILMKENQDLEKDAKDLRLIRYMMKMADDGYDIEFRRAPEGGYKILEVKKRIVKVK